MSTLIHITEAARRLGVDVRTLRRWDAAGSLKAVRTPGGHRMYHDDQIRVLEGKVAPKEPHAVVAYCRVSSRAQRPDLVNQRTAVEEFVTARGLAELETIEEIGGGMNLHRPLFLSLMDRVEAREIRIIVVAHKDRLCRFGFEWFKRFCELHGCELLVMNQERLSPEREMVEDLLAVVHTFSARLYGLRSYKKPLREALRV
jgi:excisionase family DNA binding protein